MGYPAESYERYSVPGLFAPWAARLVRSANVHPGERVLDMACGTGIVARTVAPLVGPQGAVTGLDLSPDALAVARSAAEREGVLIDWHVGPAEKLPFPDESFDLVFCQFGLMFFTDRHKALLEMKRVLKANGRAIVSVWQGLDRHPFYQILNDVTRRHLGKSSVESVFSLGEPGELLGLMTGAGFQDVEIEPASITAHYSHPEEFLAWEIGYDPAEMPALQGPDTPTEETILAAIRKDLEEPLREAMKDGQIVLPSHAFVAHSRR